MGQNETAVQFEKELKELISAARAHDLTWGEIAECMLSVEAAIAANCVADRVIESVEASRTKSDERAVR